jgi:hypothetical protein
VGGDGLDGVGHEVRVIAHGAVERDVAHELLPLLLLAQRCLLGRLRRRRRYRLE